MTRALSLISMIAVLLQACSSGPPVRKGGITLRQLYTMHDRILEYNKCIKSFSGEGHFYYKDGKRELNLLARIRFDDDNSFSRISFYGTLDNSLWGDIVVHRQKVSLYFPLRKKMYTGQLRNFDLHPFSGIHIQLAELLKLARGRIYFLSGSTRKRGVASSDHYILFLRNSEETQKVYFGKKQGLVRETRVYSGKQEKARLIYESYAKPEGVPVPRKCTLEVRSRSLRAVVWYTSVSLAYQFQKKDSLIETEPGTSVIPIN